MAVQIATDNDILLKAVAYGLSAEFWPRNGSGQLGVLGAARYVVRHWLGRIDLTRAESTAQAELEALLEWAEGLEPDTEELRLAAAVEAAAQRAGMPLDSGESQLAAMVVERSVPVLETGDKRAIAALDWLRGEIDALERLDGRVRCLEQIVRRLVSDEATFPKIAAAVCAEPNVDKTMTICFACNSPGIAKATLVLEGLDSYTLSLRAEAPSVLAVA